MYAIRSYYVQCGLRQFQIRVDAILLQHTLPVVITSYSIHYTKLYDNKGNVLIDLDRLEEALACFDAILRRTDRYPLAHYNRACVFARQGRVREAVRELAAASAQDEGYLEDARHDPDFDRIREAATFARLVGDKRAG